MLLVVGHRKLRWDGYSAQSLVLGVGGPQVLGPYTPQPSLRKNTKASRKVHGGAGSSVFHFKKILAGPGVAKGALPCVARGAWGAAYAQGRGCVWRGKKKEGLKRGSRRRGILRSLFQENFGRACKSKFRNRLLSCCYPSRSDSDRRQYSMTAPFTFSWRETWWLSMISELYPRRGIRFVVQELSPPSCAQAGWLARFWQD